MFSEDEINRYGLGECSREHVVGKKEFIDGVYNRYKDHEQQMFVVLPQAAIHGSACMKIKTACLTLPVLTAMFTRMKRYVLPLTK